MPSFTTLLAAAAALMSALPPAIAHTWIEEMQGIGENGTYIGDRGFSRGYMARTDPGFNGDSNLWMLPSLDARNPDQTVRNNINGSDLLCHPSQRTSNYTNPAYPQLKVSAGGFVAMKYLENGHVTLPWTLEGKPANGGTVLVYATTQPKADEKIVDVMQWNEDSSGGDKCGFLLGAMDYDDGECHQINTCWVSGERQIMFPNDIPGQGDAQSERWCESDIKIPETVQPGKLTLYWIWDWGTKPGQDCLAPTGKDQYYTNCADIEIIADGGNVAAGDAKIAAEAGTHTLDQQDPNTRAVRNYASRTAANRWAMTTAANWADYNAKVAATPTTGGQNSSWLSFCQTSILAQQSAAAANPESLPPLCPPGSYAPTGAEYTSWSASIKAKATNMPAAPPAAPTSAPATTAPPAPSTPAASYPTVSTPAAAPSAPAPAAPAPSSSEAPAAAGSVVTVTETQVITTTMATVAASSAPSAPASAPQPSAPAPPVDAPASDGFPTVSVISDPNAGMPSSGAPTAGPPADGAPYAAKVGHGGMGGEYQHSPRAHARAFRV